MREKVVDSVSLFEDELTPSHIRLGTTKVKIIVEGQQMNVFIVSSALRNEHTTDLRMEHNVSSNSYKQTGRQTQWNTYP